MRIWIFRILGLALVALFIVVSCSKKSPPPTSQPSPIPPSVTTQTPEQRQQQAARKVAEDKIAEYNIAKGNGDKTRKCVLAGMVATAYLTAKDEENYRLWHYYEEQDCK